MGGCHGGLTLNAIVLLVSVGIFLGTILLVVAGVLLFHLRFWGSTLEMLFAFLLSSFSLAGLGFIPASLARSARSGLVMANLLYFPMLFLSGAAIPFEMLPAFLRSFAKILPLTHAIRLMQGVWLGGHLWDYPVELVILAAVLGAGVFVPVLMFRWE